ncbi:asparagine synthase [Herbivorax sp. ANBcel31]|uniref:asparagine synthase n=1 Tax=Herbivorax sp. ANBcel31 TaxID=3069754 RepID=UPI0027B2336B|nr:asparagine synthase [Herbivorax sp. ANBcel31]MDQ2085551.1 asparagine synthase [Herbivorax sp. ANBcel31]
MKIREGTIPTVLGTVVTATGLSLKPKRSKIAWGITGFGLAHIVLGAIDLIDNRN